MLAPPSIQILLRILQKNIYHYSFTMIAILSPCFLKGQVGGDTQTDGKAANTIQTGVPFLLIAPDARSAGIGDGGVAITPDANSLHWNPSKLPFIDSKAGFSLSYVPWLRHIISDINLSYLSGYYQLDERNTIGASLRYFSLGNILLMDASQNPQGTYSPYELGTDVAFARKFGENFSIGITARYIVSKFSNGQFINGQQLKPATALAVDFSGFYKYPTTLFNKEAEVSFGINVSNIGSKISYETNGKRYSLPTNLRIGGGTSINLDADSKLSFNLDLNKLLVPIAAKYDSNSSVLSSIFTSFSDGFSEELKKISYSLGTEYWLKQMFVLRLGFLYENPTKGNRQFFTTGVGFRYQSFGLDVAYVLASPQTSPLAQTLRFSAILNIDNKDKKSN